MSPGVVLVVDAGQEYVVVIQGVRESALSGATPAELAAEIKRAVARTFELAAPSVVLVERRGVHRTTSGKVQRRSMHAAFLDGSIEGVLHEDIDPAVRGSAAPPADVTRGDHDGRHRTHRPADRRDQAAG